MAHTTFTHASRRRRAGACCGVLAAVALMLSAGPAPAAPQTLGLVATQQPVPMLCDQDGCAAQLSSFCLQRARKSPSHGARYRVAGGAGLWLHVTEAGGARRTVPAAGLVQLASARGNTAIEARVSAADRDILGAASLAVAVGPLVTLLPVATPGDPEPITPAEAAFAAGPARLVAAAIFDSPLGESLNILDRAINAVDRRARLSDQARRALWTRVAGAAAGRAEPAARVYAACLDDLARRVVYGLRDCLEGRRDEMLIRANTALWTALETGS